MQRGWTKEEVARLLARVAGADKAAATMAPGTDPAAAYRQGFADALKTVAAALEAEPGTAGSSWYDHVNRR